MALGKQMARELERHQTPVTDKQIINYVNRIGQNLAQHSDSKIPLTFKVIEGDEPNAITLPGGHIYVQMGLLRLADTEAELAAALAHEIAHVAARHGTRQATQSEVTQAATIPLLFLGGIGGVCFPGRLADFSAVGLLAVQRGYEREADTRGLQSLSKSGYYPLAMVDIFEKLFSFDERKHGKITRVFSNHPVFGVRLVSVQKNIETILKAQPEYILNTSAFDRVKAHIAELDWVPKPPPPDDSKRPTLRKAGDQLIASKKAVPESDARASQIKEAYTIK